MCMVRRVHCREDAARLDVWTILLELVRLGGEQVDDGPGLLADLELVDARCLSGACSTHGQSWCSAATARGAAGAQGAFEWDLALRAGARAAHT